MGLNDLPTDVLGWMFQFVQQHSFCSVNLRWKRLAHLKHVRCTFGDECFDKRDWFRKGYHRLEKMLARRAPESLNLTYYPMFQNDEEWLMKLYRFFAGEPGDHVVRASSFATVRRLDLTIIDTDVDLKHLEQLARINVQKRFHTINVCILESACCLNSLTDAHLKSLVALGLSGVSHFGLYSNMIDCVDASVVFPLATCLSLTHLDLGRIFIFGVDDTKALISALTQSSTIVTSDLSVSMNDMEDVFLEGEKDEEGDIVAVFLELEKMRPLRKLSLTLSDCELTDVSAVLLAQIKGWTHLQSLMLDVNFNRMTPDGVKFLTEAPVKVKFCTIEASSQLPRQ